MSKADKSPPHHEDLGRQLTQVAELLEAAVSVLAATLREIKKKEDGQDGRA